MYQESEDRRMSVNSESWRIRNFQPQSRLAEISLKWAEQQRMREGERRAKEEAIAEAYRQMFRRAEEKYPLTPFTYVPELLDDDEDDNNPGRPTPKAVIRSISEQTGIAVKLIMGNSRTVPVVKARHKAIAAVFLQCRSAMGEILSLSQLGRIFGRDHTTILHALKKEGIK